MKWSSMKSIPKIHIYCLNIKKNPYNISVYFTGGQIKRGITIISLSIDIDRFMWEKKLYDIKVPIF